MNRNVLTVVWLTIIALVLVFGWPTPYRFEQHNGALVRINRLTGTVIPFNGSHFGAAPRTTSEMQRLWDSAVVIHGEAKVLREYGPRPR